MQEELFGLELLTNEELMDLREELVRTLEAVNIEKRRRRQ